MAEEGQVPEGTITITMRGRHLDVSVENPSAVRPGLVAQSFGKIVRQVQAAVRHDAYVKTQAIERRLKNERKVAEELTAKKELAAVEAGISNKKEKK